MRGWRGAASCSKRGRRVSDPAALLREVLDRWGRPVAVVCDRWRVAELRQALEGVGFPIAAMVERGMGYRDGGQDVRDFRAAVLADKVRPSRSLLLRAALSEARVTTDPSGNAKLAKALRVAAAFGRVTTRRRRRSWPSRRASGAGTGGARRGPAGATGGWREFAPGDTIVLSGQGTARHGKVWLG